MTRPAPLHSRVFIRQELLAVSFEKSCNVTVPIYTIRELIDTLESNGYRVFAADRVKTRWFEHQVDAFLYHHRPDFRDYLHEHLRGLMASQLAQAVKDDMVHVEFPERDHDRVVPIKSHLSLIMPTQEELESERDRFVETERRRMIEEDERRRTEELRGKSWGSCE